MSLIKIYQAYSKARGKGYDNFLGTNLENEDNSHQYNPREAVNLDQNQKTKLSGYRANDANKQENVHARSQKGELLNIRAEAVCTFNYAL